MQIGLLNFAGEIEEHFTRPRLCIPTGSRTTFARVGQCSSRRLDPSCPVDFPVVLIRSSEGYVLPTVTDPRLVPDLEVLCRAQIARQS